MQRAMALAVRHAALRTPRRLLLRTGVGELRVDLVEILVADVRVTLVRHLALGGDEFQHRLLGHVS